MDLKIITFISSIVLVLFVIYGFNFKNDLSQRSELDKVLSEIINEDLTIDQQEEPIKNIKADVGNVLNKKTKNDDIYNTKKNKLLVEFDAEGAFNYKGLEGSMRKGASWGRSGVNDSNLISKPDIQSNYVYGINNNRLVSNYDHYSKDGSLSIGDTPSARVKESFRYMRTAAEQMNNVAANSYKNNIDIDGSVGKDILTYSKSKIVSPGFVSGYIESKNPIRLTDDVVPVYKDFALDLQLDLEESRNSIKLNNKKNLIFNI